MKTPDRISLAESQNINLNDYAAVEENNRQYIYLSVIGDKILNGVEIPAASAKSLPDKDTTSSAAESSEPSGISNQKSTPLPVLKNEDTIYILIDTDNDFYTGYSSVGMTIGAEKMVEITGNYGIITKKLMKDWTGSDQTEWAWTDGTEVDAAARGNELELETVYGDYWIHIVGWNGDDDTSSKFNFIDNDVGRFADSGSDCYFYYKFNEGAGTNSDDACDTDENDMTLNGASFGTGKMGNGLVLDGTNDEATASIGNIDLTADWSFEAWIKYDAHLSAGDGYTIVAFEDGDNDFSENEVTIGVHGMSDNSDEIYMCYNSCANLEPTERAGTDEDLSHNTWYHVGVAYDHSDTFADIYINGIAVLYDDSSSDVINIAGDYNGAGTQVVNIGGDSAFARFTFFDGTIDDARMVNYQRKAFGGLMLAQINWNDDTVKMYNAHSSAINVEGLEIWDPSADSTPGNSCKAFSGTIFPGLGATAHSLTSGGCNVGSTGGLYLIDVNPENSGSDSGNHLSKEWVIDGVCWNTGSGTDSDCDGSTDVMISSGAWKEDEYVNIGSDTTLQLVTNGDNDDGAGDWEQIPEFSTLLMPIASVLLIVGYNYRKRE